MARTRQIVTILLIAAYGGISILGHGLHWLAAHDGHHHGLEIVRCSIHGDGHHHAHAHDHGSQHCDSHKTPTVGSRNDDALCLTAGGCIAHSHQCEFCAFLTLASGNRPTLIEIALGQHLVGSAALAEQLPYVSTRLGWHPPRGPPSLG
jgi:hypothetical protein